MTKTKDLLGRVLQLFWDNQKEFQKKPQKRSYIAYVYGQIYAAYLKENKAEFVMVENKDVREWKRIVNWLKTNNHIVDFAYGDSEESANKLVIQGFNEENMLYKNYTDAIRKNIA